MWRALQRLNKPAPLLGKRHFHFRKPLLDGGAPVPVPSSVLFDNLHPSLRYLAGVLPRNWLHLIIDGTRTDLTPHIYTHPEYLLKVIYFLNKHTFTRYTMLPDVTAVDHLYFVHRFQVLYQLLSLHFQSRMTVSVFISEKQTVPSVTSLYRSAVCAEQEAYDMFGIFFTSHPALRRILTDLGFRGFPLRKDFPVCGYTEIAFDHNSQTLAYHSPPQFMSEYRHYSNLEIEWQNWLHEDYHDRPVAI
eukprot:TRINITY_DN1213_c0_g1_i1.p1 TRINITY_DN1213_c0_g1~~TRINITY_DN1213_c0_g1_i1.p1  ORF type:complete len:246 (-),score=28.80 TRINITY_DN1213_c0_g1_i1:10-747(-)